MSSDLRARKRLATRRLISAAADRLFFEKGFEHVTVEDIAVAAGVGRMTVFNYFPRKEDMFFDRDMEVREVLIGAIKNSDIKQSVTDKLRQLAHKLIEEQVPYLKFSEASQTFIETVERSDTLKARARAIRDEIVQELTEALCTLKNREPTDSDAYLAANMIVATWSAAFIHAHRIFHQTKRSSEAQAIFLAMIDKGSAGTMAAMLGTPYAD
ncbi:TetR/AcrR family transcriptional regulator [uncultured Tolumonas sp.]|uniref:TetR/AcrR family transcriptional regulator n=1 Tax=uncultured Tolumonas sp. TaxID=263765 RepID=UPI002931E7EA|nr:TetR/AcrR family transcriptional regulator [uncultured Tolumonas sp.]